MKNRTIPTLGMALLLAACGASNGPAGSTATAVGTAGTAANSTGAGTSTSPAASGTGSTATGGTSTSTSPGTGSTASGGGTSPGTGTSTGTGTTTAPATVAGKSTDYKITSSLPDKAVIAFTVHEPAAMVAGQTYPLVLHSHGYGGSRINAAGRPAANSTTDGDFFNLLDRGYGVISIDERGFGESGGKVRILDPYYEGQDLLQVLDWAEKNLPWLMYRNQNLVLGSVGGSYGGGYQHLIYAIDPKHRLDAMVPEITWNDLRYSLDSDNVFKSYWAALLSAVGNTKTPNGGGQDTIVNEGLAQGLATNALTAEQSALLYQNSLASYCAGENAYAKERLNNAPLTRIDAMYWQGVADTLFNQNEVVRNVQCLSKLGGDVRMFIKNQGHDSVGDASTREQCGKLTKPQAIRDWFDQKLKGVAGKADYLPKFCYQLDASSTDGVVTTSLPQPTMTFALPATTLVAQEGSPQSVSFALYTAPAGGDGAILAGIPKIHLKVADPTGTNKVGDPIVFAILAKRAAGSTTDTALQANEVKPYRGFTAAYDGELVGVANRLQPGETLSLVVTVSNAMRYAKQGTTAATPVAIEGTVSVPVLSAKLPAPPAN